MLWNSHLLSGCLHPCLVCNDIFVAQVEGQGSEDSRPDCSSLTVMRIAQSSNMKEQMAVAENGRPLGFAEGFRFHPLQAKRDRRRSRHVISRRTVANLLNGAF